jgi:hypothetical protein
MRSRLLRLGLLLLLAGLLTPFLKDFIRDVLLLPLLYITWLGRLVLASLPQVIIWGSLFIFALFVAGRSLLIQSRRRLQTYRPVTLPPGRLESWANLIDRAGQDRYARWRLARQLRKLTLAVLAQNKRQPLPQLTQELTEGRLNIPGEIQAYLQASLTSFSYFAPARFRFWFQAPPASPLDLDPEQIVRFLEDQYE